MGIDVSVRYEITKEDFFNIQKIINRNIRVYKIVLIVFLFLMFTPNIFGILLYFFTMLVAVYLGTKFNLKKYEEFYLKSKIQGVFHTLTLKNDGIIFESNNQKAILKWGDFSYKLESEEAFILISKQKAWYYIPKRSFLEIGFDINEASKIFSKVEYKNTNFKKILGKQK